MTDYTPVTGPAAKANQGEARPKPTRANRTGGNTRWHQFNRLVDRLPELTGGECKVALYLFSWAKGGLVETSERAIARGIGTSRAQVQRSLAALAEKGFVELVRRGTARKSWSVYRVLDRTQGGSSG